MLCILLKWTREWHSHALDLQWMNYSSDRGGFRPGSSCWGQTLNFTQYTEDGFETGQLVGAVFVDLTAAYDTQSQTALTKLGLNGLELQRRQGNQVVTREPTVLR